jgi:2-isopropylmalate synthase
MPYLPIDPQDIGCSYEAVIRVNSQSGKSGSAWLIEQNHGLKLPRALQQDFSLHVQHETDTHGKEMTQNALWQLFRARYGLVPQPPLALLDYQSDSQQDGQLLCRRPCASPVKRDDCRAAATACCPPPPAG